MHHETPQVPLAIIGMECRLPGAENRLEFWNLLSTGRSGIVELPADRLDRELYYDPRKGQRNKSYSALGGLVASRPLDRTVCPIAEELIATADVAHLNLCEVAAAACRNAGLDPTDLPLRNTGVYVGHTAASPLAGQIAYAAGVAEMAQYLRDIEPFRSLRPSDQRDLIDEVVATVRRDCPRMDPQRPTRLSSHAAAELIARAFSLSGPHLVVDAACASSLQALALSAAALRQGRIDMAIVGGASYCKSDTLVLFSQAQSLSATGSRPFDAAADGLILAEGYVVIVVKTLQRALADGDSIQAVIRGVGMATDGRGKSLWAPRKEGQVLAIRRAYEPNLDAGELDYVEAHATSTQLGDATELQALAEALGGRLPPGKKIPLGSVKANVGHTLEAAGLAGLAKTMLCLEHGAIPSAIHCTQLNGEIDWSRAPFYLSTSQLSWQAPADRPRRAGINSFGIGGLNVHVVLDDFRDETQNDPRIRTPSGGRTSAEREAVAIVGAGCILPGARTIEAFWELLLSGRDATTPLPAARWNPAAGVDPRTGESLAARAIRGGFITDYAYDWKRHVVPPKQVEQANPLQFMLLDATEAALHDGGFDGKTFDRARATVLVGTIFGDEFAQHLNLGLRLPQFERTLCEVLEKRGIAKDQHERICRDFGEVLLKHMPALVDETGSFTSSTLASRISKAFDFQGGALALDAGAASGLAVLAAGVDLLLDGSCEMVVCAAGDRNLGLVNFEAYVSEGKLADGNAWSPFDQRGHGSVPGEGVGVILLKRLSDAQRDGNRIRGVIRGVGAATGHSVYDTTRLAIHRALRDAQIAGVQVSAVEMTSVGIAANDAPHVRAIAEALRPIASPPLFLGCLTGQIGNTGAAAGIAGVIKATLALDGCRLPPNAGLQQGAPWLRESESVLANSQVVHLPHDATGAGPFVGVTAVAGANLMYHIILERAENMVSDKGPSAAESKPAWASLTPQSPVLRFSANDFEALVAKVQAATQSSLDRYRYDRFNTTDSWRLAIVGADESAILPRLALAASQISNPAAGGPLEDQGIFWARAHQPPRFAFLFPGQGSQSTGMVLNLIDQCPCAAEACREVDAALALLKLPGFRQLSTDSEGLLGVDVFRTQLGMLLANLVMYRVVSSLGVTPAVVAGHSFGEFAALVAAGAWTLEQAIGATIERSRAIESQSSDAPSAMLSIAATEEVVRHELAGLQDVFVSHQNAPEQTVVAGPARPVHEFAARLRAAGFESRPLAVPRPFHTPLMASAQDSWRAALDSVWISQPRIPFISSVTNQRTLSPGDIRDNLVEQLTAPVRYVDLIRSMVREGITAFVEIGPQQVLTRLHRRILSDTTCVAIATDSPKRTPAEQLARLVAQLDCIGAFDQVKSAQTNPTIVHRHRPVQEFVNYDATAARRAKLRAEGLGESDQSKNRPLTASIDAQAGDRAAINRPNGAELTAPTLSNGAEHAPNLQGPKVAVRVRVGAPKSEDLEQFLVNFVIEQTGYPAEIVRMDADLEADLGIDSIKKAQLFGELAEFYDVTTPENLRLDNFPTLRHVATFLQTSDNDSEQLDDSVDGHSMTAAPQLASQPVTPELIAKVPTAAGGHAQASAPPATIPSQPSYSVPVARGAVTIRARANAPQLAELEQFLVNFVIEQTGYPPEIVRLDADLEADLGIDSIKKAQLFGELAEFYEVSTPENLRLDDFPTLRSVLELLKASSAPEAAELCVTAPLPPDETIRSPTDLTIFDRVVRLLASLLEDEPNGALSIPAHEATAFEIGRRFGQHQRSQLRSMLKRAADNWNSEKLLKTVPLADTASGPMLFGEQVWEQLQGVAAGAGVHIGNIVGAYQRAGGALGRAPQAPSNPPTATQRLVLRMVEAPLAAATSQVKFVPQGAALILGDNPLARALQGQLTARGFEAIVVAGNASCEAVVEQLDHLWARRPIAHLFLTTPHDAAARLWQSEATWNQRRDEGVLVPFRLCQEWIRRVNEAHLAPVATLVAVTSLGGDFGLSSRVTAVEGGALAGLVKSIYIDSLYEPWKGVRCQVYDFSADDPPTQTATLVFQELERCESNLEIGFRAGKRRLLRAVLQEAQSEPNPPEPSGVWVVTGGGRGVTALAAIELAKRYPLKLHLLGTAPKPEIDPSWRNLSPAGLSQLKTSILRDAAARGLPPLEAWSKVDKAIQIDATLRACAAARVQATYHCCDVSDRARLKMVLDAIRAVDGPIDGILHGAAAIRDAAFEGKKLASVRTTLAAKNDAAAALMELTCSDPLRHFVAFTSMSGRFGFRGQSDYAAANEWLAKQVDDFRAQRPECRSVSIHWHAWDGVGLAAREELQATFAAMAVKFMPRAEAIGHLMREIAAGLPEVEVLFTDAQFLKDHYPLPVVATDAEATEIRDEPETLRSAGGQRILPLVNSTHRGAEADSLSASVILEPQHDPFLTQHLLNGRPLLPMVIGMECLAEAAQSLGKEEVVGFQQIEIAKGLLFKQDIAVEVRVAAARNERGAYHCRLTSTPDASERKPGDTTRLHMSAEIVLGQRRALPGDDFPGEPPLGWFPLAYPDDAPIFHGPLWRALTQVAFQYDGAYGRITAPDVRALGGARTGATWILPAVALDACFYACGSFLYSMFGKQIEIPAGIDQLRLGRLPEAGEVCTVRILFREQLRRGSRFDFRLYGANHDCLLQVDGYRTMVIVRGENRK